MDWQLANVSASSVAGKATTDRGDPVAQLAQCNSESRSDSTVFPRGLWITLWESCPPHRKAFDF
jgi:hypothetical protein